MKKRLAYLLLALFSLNLSINNFPTIESNSFSMLLSQFIFSPFSWLGSIIFFIVGFLAIARIVKELTENIILNRSIVGELTWIGLLIVLFIYLFLTNMMISLAALMISLFYGIMDAKDSCSKKQLKQLDN